jgi:hypothetical protein
MFEHNKNGDITTGVCVWQHGIVEIKFVLL